MRNLELQSAHSEAWASKLSVSAGLASPQDNRSQSPESAQPLSPVLSRASIEAAANTSSGRGGSLSRSSKIWPREGSGLFAGKPKGRSGFGFLLIFALYLSEFPVKILSETSTSYPVLGPKSCSHLGSSLFHLFLEPLADSPKSAFHTFGS